MTQRITRRNVLARLPVLAVPAAFQNAESGVAQTPIATPDAEVATTCWPCKVTWWKGSRSRSRHSWMNLFGNACRQWPPAAFTSSTGWDTRAWLDEPGSWRISRRC